jgi:hypothetical protein
VISTKKSITIIAAGIGALLLAAGIALPSASADPTNAPGPNPTVSNQPPSGDEPLEVQRYNKRNTNGYPFDADAGQP